MNMFDTIILCFREIGESQVYEKNKKKDCLLSFINKSKLSLRANKITINIFDKNVFNVYIFGNFIIL